MMNQSEQRRRNYYSEQMEFDFEQENKKAKLKWIEEVIFPMLEEK